MISNLGYFAFSSFWSCVKPLFSLEGFISPEIFNYFFINSDSNLTQTHVLTLKLSPNQTLTQTLILTFKKANEKSASEHFSFSFYSL